MLNGKIDVLLLNNKPGLCLKGALQCRRNNYLYAIVEMGYASQHAGVVGSIPIRVIASGSSVDRAQLLWLQVRVLLSLKRDSSTVEHYIDNVG